VEEGDVFITREYSVENIIFFLMGGGWMDYAARFLGRGDTPSSGTKTVSMAQSAGLKRAKKVVRNG